MTYFAKHMPFLGSLCISFIAGSLKDAWEYHFLIQGVGEIPHNPFRSPKPKNLISTLLTAPGRINQEIFRCKLNLNNVDNPYDALDLMGVGMGTRAAILTKYKTIYNQGFD